MFFLTGTDEHGIKMLQTAKAQGITPASLPTATRRTSATWSRALDCSNDDFIRTREQRHMRACEELWRRMQDARRHLSRQICRLVLGARRGLLRRERAEAGGGRPKLSPQGTPVEWVEEESYFFRLSAYQDRLLAHYDAHPEFIGPDTRGATR